MRYWQLFWVYFQIGLFGFGGGYAMLSLIQHKVVTEQQWITSQEFADIVAISQSTPGPIGINSATYIGYTVTQNVWGSLIASTAVCLPSFFLMWLGCKFMIRFKGARILTQSLSLLRPVIIGLIASAAILLMNKENFTDWVSVIIFLVAFCSVYFFKLHPILLLIAAGLFGFIWY